MKTFKELNFAPDAIIGNDAGHMDPEFVKSLGKDANYILSREVWALDLGAKKPMLKTVADMFEKRTGKPMDGSSSRAFTAMIVLADAINRAGSTDPAKIQKALLETNLKADQLIMPWDGVKFDPQDAPERAGKGHHRPDPGREILYRVALRSRHKRRGLALSEMGQKVR